LFGHCGYGLVASTSWGLRLDYVGAAINHKSGGNKRWEHTHSMHSPFVRLSARTNDFAYISAGNGSQLMPNGGYLLLITNERKVVMQY